MGVLRNLKLTALGACRGAGMFGTVQRSRWRRERLLILAYHGISLEREHDWNGGLFMPPTLLRARLEAIRRAGLQVLPLGTALEQLRDGRLSEPSVVLTFDDGFHDFHRVAAPMLLEFGYPATVYLTTFYVEHQRPLPNLITSYMLWLRRNGQFEVDAKLWGGPLERLTPESWDPIAARLRGFATEHRISAADKDAITENLAGQLDLDYAAICKSRVMSLLDHDEIRELTGQGFDFQLHTHRHRTPDDEALFRREIRDNRDRIEALTGHPADHFCYPSGHYKAEFLPWLRQEGVVSATTCDAGMCALDTELLLLPRKVDTCLVTPVEFEAWLSGCEPWMRPGTGQAQPIPSNSALER